MVKPKRVGVYLFQELLVSGGAYGPIAEFQRATHTPTGETVMVKTLKKSILERHPVDWKRELKILQSLRHPCIVEIFEYLDTVNSIYLIYEDVPGESLAKNLKRKRYLGEADTRRIIRQLASALDYLHDQKIILGFLTLETIHIGKTDKVKITDFSLADWILNFKVGSIPISFLGYMAPELLEEEQRISRAIDVWCLGVCFFTLLKGSLPFKVENTKNLEVLLSTLFRGLDLPANCSDKCKLLIVKMLRFDATSRPAVKEILRDAWMREGSASVRSATQPVWIPPVNEEIVRQMAERYDVAESRSKEVIQSRQPGAVYALYRMLQARIARKKGFPDDSSPEMSRRSARLKTSHSAWAPLSEDTDSAFPSPRHSQMSSVNETSKRAKIRLLETIQEQMIDNVLQRKQAYDRRLIEEDIKRKHEEFLILKIQQPPEMVELEHGRVFSAGPPALTVDQLKKSILQRVRRGRIPQVIPERVAPTGYTKYQFKVYDYPRGQRSLEESSTTLPKLYRKPVHRSDGKMRGVINLTSIGTQILLPGVASSYQ